MNQPNRGARVPRSDAPPPGEWLIRAVTQTAEGGVYHLRQEAQIENADMLFRADEIDYDEDSGDLQARGHVYFKNFERNEELYADHLEYNVQSRMGRFYKVHGSGHPHIDARPGVLTTNNPFYFEGEWAERVEDRYILHNGFVTDCRVPRPWWILRGPKFDIIPGERAIAYRTAFKLKRFPLFYTPFFYKSLEKVPRRSGFLTPNLGNSSRRGKMIGIGYYWAMNRSYDTTYRLQEFTERGLAHHIEIRGKPRERTDFDVILYGVQDRGLVVGTAEPGEFGLMCPEGTVRTGADCRRKEGGFSISAGGKSDLGHGFYARASVNYLSSLTFRQAFTESFNEAIFSESHSVGFVAKHWSAYDLNIVAARLENFQTNMKGDSVVIRKLPQLDFRSRDQQVKDLPFWVSLDSAAGLVRRSQPLFQTRQFLERIDFRPRIMTALRWKDFHLLPSFSLRESYYGERQEDSHIFGKDINRTTREIGVDLIAPSLERIFNKKTFFGEKLKHVIEPRASFRDVRGVQDFNKYILFDETELVSNTTEVEVSVINRLYARKGGNVNEILSWQLWQRRYFDPSFGGAVIEGRRNVVLSSADLTPYAFLDGPRRYSPVVSAARVSPMPGFGIEWRADYDPLRGHLVNSGFTTDYRRAKYFLSVGHTQVHNIPLQPPGEPRVAKKTCDQAVQERLALLSPCASQFRGLLGFGDNNRRGWSAAFTAIYDFRVGAMQFATTQVTYNTDCCGLSVQYRRLAFGNRNENQFRVAFAVSNIGSFGTLKKQERLF